MGSHFTVFWSDLLEYNAVHMLLLLAPGCGLPAVRTMGLRSDFKYLRLTQNVALPVPQFGYSVVFVLGVNKQTAIPNLARFYFVPQLTFKFFKQSKCCRDPAAVSIFTSRAVSFHHLCCTSRKLNICLMNQHQIDKLFLVCLLGVSASTCFGRYSPIFRGLCTDSVWCNYVRRMSICFSVPCI
jgi:hypothetical protein